MSPSGGSITIVLTAETMSPAIKEPRSISRKQRCPRACPGVQMTFKRHGQAHPSKWTDFAVREQSVSRSRRRARVRSAVAACPRTGTLSRSRSV